MTLNNLYDLECPICLEEFDNNNYIIVDCCNKTFHISCIVEWYTKNPNNNHCFVCNRYNSFCKEFIYHNDSSNISLASRDTSSNHNFELNNIIIDNQNDINIIVNNNYVRTFCIIIIVLFVIISIIIYIYYN